MFLSAVIILVVALAPVWLIPVFRDIYDDWKWEKEFHERYFGDRPTPPKPR